MLNASYKMLFLVARDMSHLLCQLCACLASVPPLSGERGRNLGKQQSRRSLPILLLTFCDYPKVLSQV